MNTKSSNIIYHDTSGSETIPRPSQGKKQIGRKSDTSSLIGGIDAGGDKWKTTYQLQGEVPSEKTKHSHKRRVENKGKESFEFGTTPIERLRKQLASRGATGISGLARRFKSMDDDGSRSLSMAEFNKAIKEYRLDFTEAEIAELFNLFDRDRSGTIGYEEFLQKIRGRLNMRRKELVHLAFNKIDKDGSGILDIDDIIGVYDASKHPDVISGKRKPEDVLSEFLETFDVGGEVDGKVTLDEFENYYSNISASIDSDDYFELMIRNAWHISGGEGVCENSANRRVLVTRADGTQAVEEIKDDLGLKADDKEGMMSRLRGQGVDVAAVDVHSGGENGVGKDKKMNPRRRPTGKKGLNKGFTGDTVASTSYGINSGYISKGNEVNLGRPGSAGYKTLASGVSRSMAPSKSSAVAAPTVNASDAITARHPVFLQLKEQLASRGAVGIAGLGRAFKRMDFDGSKSLNFEEFDQALNESGLKLTQPQKRQLFAFFDKDRTGSIGYNEFITGLRGTLNDRRRKLVHMAFKKLDRDGNGTVEIQDVISIYDASKHPDVISGKRTNSQVLMEFLETFDVGGEVDGKVTLDEFENYYSNISASIDSDDYFELMIRNAWHISGGKGVCENSANRRVLVTRADGAQAVEEIKDDLGLKADDKEGMMSRLRGQGVDASSIDLTYGTDTRKPRAASARARGRGRQANSNQTNSMRHKAPAGSGVHLARSLSRRASEDLSTAENSETNNETTGEVFVGMTLPNGLVVKGIDKNVKPEKKINRPPPPPSSSPSKRSGMHMRRSNINDDEEEQVEPAISGGDLETLKELKMRAFRLYVRKNYQEAERLYQEALDLTLALNGNNMVDPEYVKGKENVNKCRDKMGMKPLGASDDEEDSVW